MLCHLTRWMISQAHDKGRKMPRFVSRHAGRCEGCRAYSRFAGSLPSRLFGEIPAVLAEVPDFLPRRIPPISDEAGLERPSRSRLRLFLRPVPAAALLFVLGAGITILWILPGGSGPTETETKKALADLKYVTTVPDILQSAVANAESSLVRERLVLEKSVCSACDYLQARLNIRIERTEQRTT